MTERRNVEVFTAGCALCDEAVQLVLLHTVEDPTCNVTILHMTDESTQKKASEYGVTRVPAIAVDGRLADCCRGSAIDGDTLRSLGIGSPA